MCIRDSVNTEVGEIATQVGTTPAGWNAGIFNMIRSLSENVIAVSYTHLDVYKRQAFALARMEERIFRELSLE